MNLGGVWDRSGWGALLNLCDIGEGSTWLWEEPAVIPQSLEGWDWLVPCRLWGMGLLTTWRCVVPCESGKKALLAWEHGPLHPELWQSFSWEHFGVKPFLAQRFHWDFICVSIKKLPLRYSLNITVKKYWLFIRVENVAVCGNPLQCHQNVLELLQGLGIPVGSVLAATGAFPVNVCMC